MIRRVPVDEGEHGCPYVAGRVYQRKLRGLDGRPAFRVTLEPRKQRLSTVTHKEALAEGFHGGKALRGWQVAWVRENDRAWMRLHPTASDADLLRRFRARHADRDCWVLHVALIDPVRCMPTQRDTLAGRARDDGYVSCAGMSIDPYAEAVSASDLIRLTVQGLEDRPSRRERRKERHKRLFEGGRA